MPPRTRSGRTIQPELVGVDERPIADVKFDVDRLHAPPCESQSGSGEVGYVMATCSFTAFQPAMGLAVQTSVGMARFFRHKPLERCGLVAPYGLLKETDYAKFREGYLARLDAKAGDIANRFAEYGDRHGLPLVLLCFEDLSKPDTWCHRTILREWLQERTGVIVPELGPVR
jgi:hypothetical protein